MFKENEKILENLSAEIHQTSLLPNSDSLTNLILSFISLLSQNISYLKKINRLSKPSSPSLSPSSPLFIPIKTIDDYLLPPTSPLLPPSSSPHITPSSSSHHPPLSISMEHSISFKNPSSFLINPPPPSSLLRERLLGFTKSEINSPINVSSASFGEESISPTTRCLNRKSRFYKKKSRGLKIEEEETKSRTEDFIELNKEELMEKGLYTINLSYNNKNAYSSGRTPSNSFERTPSQP